MSPLTLKDKFFIGLGLTMILLGVSGISGRIHDTQPVTPAIIFQALGFLSFCLLAIATGLLLILRMDALELIRDFLAKKR